MTIEITIPDQFVTGVQGYLKVATPDDIQAAIQTIINDKIRTGLLQAATDKAASTALAQINQVLPVESTFQITNN